MPYLYSLGLINLNRGRRGGERTLMGKQMTFRRDKWPFRRTDDRYGFVTMSV